MPASSETSASATRSRRRRSGRAARRRRSPRPGGRRSRRRSSRSPPTAPRDSEGARQCTRTRDTTTSETQTRDTAVIERERCAGIARAARALGVDGQLAEGLICDAVPLEDARARLIDERERTGLIATGPAPCFGQEPGQRRTRDAWLSRAAPGNDTGAEFRAAATDALLLRAGISLAKPHPAARDVDRLGGRTWRGSASRRAGRTVASPCAETLVRSARRPATFRSSWRT